MDGAAPPAHRSASYIRVSPALGVVAGSGADHRESQGRVSRVETAAVVCASTVIHPTASRARLGESGEPERRAVGDGCDAYSLWARWVGAFGCGDRLSRSRSDRLRVRTPESSEGSGASRRSGLPGSVRDAASDRSSRAAKRQRADLPESAVPAGLSRLSSAAGVHHALHAGAEWDDRTVLSESERGVRLATHVPDL